jgi:hypothetical protein
VSDPGVKKRMSRATRKAAEDLADLGYDVLVSDGNPAQLVAYRAGDIRVIRICLDDVSVSDKKLLGRLSSSHIVSRELWTRFIGKTRFVVTKL